jgi:hypothetical protein
VNENLLWDLIGLIEEIYSALVLGIHPQQLQVTIVNGTNTTTTVPFRSDAPRQLLLSPLVGVAGDSLQGMESQLLEAKVREDWLAGWLTDTRQGKKRRRDLFKDLVKSICATLKSSAAQEESKSKIIDLKNEPTTGQGMQMWVVRQHWTLRWLTSPPPLPDRYRRQNYRQRNAVDSSSSTSGGSLLHGLFEWERGRGDEWDERDREEDSSIKSRDRGSFLFIRHCSDNETGNCGHWTIRSQEQGLLGMEGRSNGMIPDFLPRGSINQSPALWMCVWEGALTKQIQAHSPTAHCPEECQDPWSESEEKKQRVELVSFKSCDCRQVVVSFSSHCIGTLWVEATVVQVDLMGGVARIKISSWNLQMMR